MSVRNPARRGFIAAAAAAAAGVALPARAHDPIRIPDPPTGRALVVFYRRWLYGGAAVSYMVREGERDLGVLSAGAYFAIFADPGLHTYTVRSERHSDAQLVVEADETYYLSCDLGTGWLLYQPSLTPIGQWRFLQVSDNLHYVAPLVPGPPP